MITTLKTHHVTLVTIILFISMSLTPSILSQSIENNLTRIPSFEGKILFSPMVSTTTYLINSNGEVIHTWPNANKPGYAVYALENGNILRAARHNDKLGGMVQEIAWNGEIMWEFIYDSSEYLSHHDIEPLPNGNVLITAWEYKTINETIDAGRNPNLDPSGPLIPDHIIEVEPTGPTSGDIIWEWHVWDHLIQDYDPLKNNYGIVEDHHELIDINFISSHSIEISDWTHVNAIDYNENLDQIMLSSWYFNEIWIIDHSTTTEEAKGHTGGQYGHGGDLLYRWGNPQTYHACSKTDQKLFGQHDAQWIKTDHPGAGNILIFNNGLDRPEGRYSSIEEIIPPITENGTYLYYPGQPYLPENSYWTYIADIPTTFYSTLISGCQRLPTGNTLICNGNRGIFFEVTPEKEVVWEYTNPYPNYFSNSVFKICYIPPEQSPSEPNLDCNGSLTWAKILSGSTQSGTFTIANIGEEESLLNWEIKSYPDWGTWTFNPNQGVNLAPDDGSITVHVELIAPDEKNQEFNGNIVVMNTYNNTDFGIIPVSLSTGKSKIQSSTHDMDISSPRIRPTFNSWFNI